MIVMKCKLHIKGIQSTRTPKAISFSSATVFNCFTVVELYIYNKLSKKKNGFSHITESERIVN